MLRAWAGLSFTLAALLLAACGNRPLSRSDAEKVLKSGLGLPKFTTANIPKRFLRDAKGSMGYLCSDALGQEWLNGNLPMLEPLRNSGLIEFGQDFTKHAGHCRYSYATIKLTEKGKAFLVGETEDAYVVNEYQLLLGDITGIRMGSQNSEAEVNYTLVRAPAFNAKTNPQHENHSVILARYDDGWRLLR